jgi:methyltransferase (TIGR00027 family)
MSEKDALIRNISDTALWVAVYRAKETERKDAWFRDPFAKRLAGERGERIAATLPMAKDSAWSMVTRTVLMDTFVAEQVKEGADLVINLAAGLDARPYRMDLPASLRWIEVDLPEILAYKEEILRGEKPVCQLERITLDLSNVEARREFFAKQGRDAKRVLVITEGLLIYWFAEEVASLARDLAVAPSFQAWILDLASPGLMRMLLKKIGPQLSQGGAPFKFAPLGGVEFFSLHGWQASDVRSLLKAAARLKRLPLFLRLIALLPEKKGPAGSRPWSGICLLRRK